MCLISSYLFQVKNKLWILLKKYISNICHLYQILILLFLFYSIVKNHKRLHKTARKLEKKWKSNTIFQLFETAVSFVIRDIHDSLFILCFDSHYNQQIEARKWFLQIFSCWVFTELFILYVPDNHSNYSRCSIGDIIMFIVK